MENHKKTFVGSIIAFFLGTSCCWMSAVAVWLGGAASFGIIIKWIENVQTQLFLLGVLLVMLSFYLFQRNKKNKLVK